MQLYLPKTLTVNDHIKSVEAKGRHVGKPVGSYVIDLADLKKTIALCSGCVSGFDPKAHHYTQHNSIPRFRGDCDACDKFDLQLIHLCPEERNY